MSSLKNKKINKIADVTISSSNIDNKKFDIYEKETKEKNTEKIEIDKLEKAPSDLNWFMPLDKKQMEELEYSITSEGLINPIVVWENDNCYMILSGHNRVQAYINIYDKTKDESYKKIEAKIFKKNELTKEKAYKIIVMSNLAVRSKYSRSEKINIIKFRMDYLNDARKDICEQLDIKSSVLYEYYQIGTLCIDEIQKLYCEEKIKQKTAYYIKNFSREIQKYLYDNHLELLLNDKIKKVPNDLTEIEEVENYIKSLNIEEKKQTKKISVKCPNVELSKEEENELSLLLEKTIVEYLESRK